MVFPLNKDITTGETFGDKIKLIQTDFKQFMDMIKEDYRQKVEGKYGLMNNIKSKIQQRMTETGGLPEGIPNLEQTINLKMSQLQLRRKFKETYS